MKFSERQGITKVKDIIQFESMDDDLRNSLWNVFYNYVLNDLIKSTANAVRYTTSWSEIKNLWKNFYIKPIDSIPYSIRDTIEYIKYDFFNYDWYEVYDFIEYIVKTTPHYNKSFIISDISNVLIRECSAYRLINEEFVPISNEEHIKSIQEVLDSTSTGKLIGVSTHIKTALTLMSDKTNPDYRNSIKESISALESLCIIISGKPKATLGNALSALNSKIELHKSLEKSFCQLYGYTSDGDGIRHGMLDIPTLDQEDAIYMLVSCSSFINYLMVKASKAQIKFD